MDIKELHVILEEFGTKSCGCCFYVDGSSVSRHHQNDQAHFQKFPNKKHLVRTQKWRTTLL